MTTQKRRHALPRQVWGGNMWIYGIGLFNPGFATAAVGRTKYTHLEHTGIDSVKCLD